MTRTESSRTRFESKLFKTRNRFVTLPKNWTYPWPPVVAQVTQLDRLIGPMIPIMPIPRAQVKNPSGKNLHANDVDCRWSRTNRGSAQTGHFACSDSLLHVTNYE